VNTFRKIALAALVVAPLAAHAADEAPALKLSGMVDSYYTIYPTETQDYVSPTLGYTSASGFNLNFAKVTAAYDTDKAGFRLDLGFGPEGQLISTGIDPNTGDGNGSRIFVQQAYASMKFSAFTVEFGRFVTPAGFEVYEAKDNWLYTKGLIFNFAVPTAHEGLRVAVPLGEGLTATAYLVNGSDLWSNDVGLTGSPYKTGALNLVYSKDSTTAAVTGFYGYIPGTDGEAAYLVDAVITQGFGMLSLNVSGDYGSTFNAALGDSSTYYAVGASAKADLGMLSVVGRAEYFSDEDDVRGTGTDSLTSLTAGVIYPVGTHSQLRLEGRYDMAGDDIYGSTEPKDNVTSVTVGAVAWF
jgi:hypothetical protein